MPRQPEYRAGDHITTGDDPYTRPAFSFANRAARLLWNITWLLLYRLSPRPFHAWRAMLLRLFGATLGPHCHFYPASRVWAPWNLRCADHVAAGNGVEIYNPSPMQLGSHVILSQDCYLCGAGVRVGEGAVLGLGSIATRDLDPWTVYSGNPAQPIRQRTRTAPNSSLANS
jgi:putative colanic acid biosynthesis acetyltransferase WcaF